MIRNIHHTAISTGDVERSLRFYKDLFGFTEVFSSAWKVGSEITDNIVGLKDSSARVTMLRLGDTYLELFQYATPPPKLGEARRPVCDHGITHFCVDVTDIDAEYTRLKAAGMVFHCPPQTVGKGVRATYGRDPDGNVVELLEQESPTSLASVMRE